MSASASARRYSELSESEQKIILTEVAWEAKRISDGNSEWLNPTIRVSDLSLERFSRAICDFDHNEKFINSTDERKLIALKQFQKGESVNAFFVLNEVCRVDDIIAMSLDRDSTFESFEKIAIHTFSKSNLTLGSQSFRKCLYQYFLKYTYWYEDESGYLRQSRIHDPYMMHAALLLIRVYKEQRVQALLEHMISDTPINIRDFIRVTKSNLSIEEITDYPLLWTLNLIES